MTQVLPIAPSPTITIFILFGSDIESRFYIINCVGANSHSCVDWYLWFILS